MIRLDLFRALNPPKDYPTSPLNLTLNGVRYDVLLPDYVSDVFIKNASRINGLSRIDKFCGRTGIEQLRNSPHLLHALVNDAPVYADADFSNELADKYGPSASTTKIVAICTPPIISIFDVMEHLKIVEGGVAQYIRSNSHYFKVSGGFEIAQVAYYFNASDLNDVRIGQPIESRLTAADHLAYMEFMEFGKRNSSQQTRTEPPTR